MKETCEWKTNASNTGRHGTLGMDAIQTAAYTYTVYYTYRHTHTRTVIPRAVGSTCFHSETH